MGFSEINIQKFRGIDNLTLTDCKQINLIAGCNNSGKSSVLEAIFMLTGLANSELYARVNNLRGYIVSGGDDLKLLFYNLDTTTPIKFRGSLTKNDELRELSIIPIVNNEPVVNNNLNGISNDIGQNNFLFNVSKSIISGLKSDFSIKEKHKSIAKGSSSLMVGSNNQLSVTLDKKYKEKIKGSFIASANVFNSFVTAVDEIIKNKQGQELVKVLQSIEPRIVDINTGLNGAIRVDIGLDSLIPINVMGDGIRKLLTIITTIYDSPNGILLIDEIENGLHYSALKSLWKAIIAAAKRFNVQIFATTHNIETLQYLKDVVKEDMPDFEKEVRFYTIQKVASDETKAYKYDFEQFESALEKGIEIR